MNSIVVFLYKIHFISSPNDLFLSSPNFLLTLPYYYQGCIVNGPGEMADADFGYVGGAPGKVDLYVGKDVIKRAIPNELACDALVQLIKDNNR